MKKILLEYSIAWNVIDIHWSVTVYDNNPAWEEEM